MIELRKVKRGNYFKLADDSVRVFVRGEYIPGKKGFGHLVLVVHTSTM